MRIKSNRKKWWDISLICDWLITILLRLAGSIGQWPLMCLYVYHWIMHNSKFIDHVNCISLSISFVINIWNYVEFKSASQIRLMYYNGDFVFSSSFSSSAIWRHLDISFISSDFTHYKCTRTYVCMYACLFMISAHDKWKFLYWYVKYTYISSESISSSVS